ncbi:hypothetical protein Pmani_004484 [Petrolisthes manimaculis]|uniref:Uncharacterized protein n=1 Tax=Petrolisthes manimaculis TaxID=1843537 RepID=A0AAE1QG73_9EUCA|nr:hypothetical protein Pmani_004484 [Petrolisthes manimaculis]
MEAEEVVAQKDGRTKRQTWHERQVGTVAISVNGFHSVKLFDQNNSNSATPTQHSLIRSGSFTFSSHVDNYKP